CPTAEDLIDLGESFGQMLKEGDVVALHGDLGVGKTTFTKGIALALDITDPITSPTFNIIYQYSGTMHLIHVDAYRLDRCEYLGIWDYMPNPRIIVLEWPENLIELRESVTKNIQIKIQEKGERRVCLI
ncbi:MAG: tRNA (adenosine(37)-N6)-threonylcarbamoyltransferase complex ATPase subunit type 1 TsaE, partial [Puniceicoccales bacterium]|nr:tRNA (adenosine(37)-N6)-threonylcarbamoyltransferase complex ATPase subunit type 1 TsaE [Puniceicoccales bacterium]